METGNLRLYILRTLLTKEKYDKLKSEIDISIFKNEDREIYKKISNKHKDHNNITQINFSKLKLAYFNI